MQLVPYLTFNGNCEAAMTFYKDALGGEITAINRMKDGPADMGVPEALGDKIMHMSIEFDGNTIMASDNPGPDEAIGNNVTLSIQSSDPDAAGKLFDRLSAGGQLVMPFEDQFWGARFGMFTDQFGIRWSFNCMPNR